jgi:type IV pilus assembly protein PilY1
MPVQADDIDVYNTVGALPYPPYAPTGDIAPPNPNYPNILFILDASLSMNATDKGQVGTRLQRLRQAMEKVLTETQNVNIALMRFSHGVSGGRIIYPMSPIEFAREDAIEMVNTMGVDFWTPTIGAMLEAAYYFRGEPVFYGTTRTRVPGNKKHQAEQLGRVSHPESYTGGVLVQEGNCTPDNLDHVDCKTERIDGDPVYRSPILGECQQNFAVLISDGGATNTVDIPATETLINGSCAPSNSNTCGVEIAEFLATEDQVTDLAGDNTVTTHTVGFNASLPPLERFAAAGGGNYYESSSAADLAAAMNNIIENASGPPSTLAQPAVTIDLSNRLAHRKDIYLSLFEPVLRPVWPGNLKGYWQEGTVKDYSNPRIKAIDPDTGAIVDTAQSRWSTSPDGSDVSTGGAASKIKHSLTRNVVTNHPNGPTTLLDDANQIDINNITAAELDLPDWQLSLAASDHNRIIDWVRGMDVLDVNENGDVTENRNQYGDPLHTNPLIATYGRTATNDYDSVVFFGTNDGFLNAVDTQTGTDLYAFMPWSLVPQIKHSFVNQPYGAKLYGMDGYLSSWFSDGNGNGLIDNATDHFYLYAGMRRGGRDYHALDITTKNNPEHIWSIHGGSGDFTELGQSWSKLVHGKMHHPSTGKVTDVVVFSGGFDEAYDGSVAKRESTMGRAIYIVDAATGKLIWNAAPSNASLELADMKYSIPATPTLLDIDSDGVFDQIYAGDLGGQVWRFDFPANGTITGGIIATLSDLGDKLFFSSPDVSLLKKSDLTLQVAVSIGSGARHQPLDQAQNNSFYVILQDDVREAPAGYGVKRDNNKYTPITHDDLADVTDNDIQEGNNLERDTAADELAQKHGWYLNMEVLGEKILNPSITIDHKVIFTSYVPSPHQACEAGLGNSFLYALNITDGTPLGDIDGDGEIRKGDRRKELKTPGISATPSIVFPGDDGNVNVMVGRESAGDLDIDLMRRTYWSEVPDY